jgi:BirA family biotin operon repressor/biotin-[acetyl-CoA-carboxylase] ligase
MALIDPLLLNSRLGSLAGRFDVDALDTCDSTSSELLRRAERGAPAGSVVVADRQSAGRGRRGRQWLSAAHESLTFSVLWRFTAPASRLAGLSLAVGVGLLRALDKLGARDVFLKWPNDVLLRSGNDSAKIAGVLIELAADRRGTQVIIGIGLNLQRPTADMPQAAAGLCAAMPSPPERHDVLAAILCALADIFETVAADGFIALKNEWQSRHLWQDQPVQIIAEEGEPQAGICRGVDHDGALLLETGSGIQRIFSGDVSLRPISNSQAMHGS